MTEETTAPDGAESIDKKVWIDRFVAHMCKLAGFERFADGELVADYAAKTAETYLDDPDYVADGPEACAEGDMDCWESE